MAIVEKMLSGSWQYGEGERRIEDAAIQNPGINDQLARLALRFISAKGLADEFADALDEIAMVEDLSSRLGHPADEDEDDPSPDA